MSFNKPDFPPVIDSTILTSFRMNPTRCKLEYFEHWKPKAESVHLVAGAAFAKGLEVARKAFYQEGALSEDAIAAGLQALVTAYGSFECPPESTKSLERMCGALEYYFSAYPMESDAAVPVTMPSGQRGIEFSFAEPTEIRHPQTGDPILYAGRMDQVVNFANAVYGFDDKTTSHLGPSWSQQWDLRNQFFGYSWGAKRGGFPMQGFIIRGISILKHSYDTQQAIIYHPQWMLDRWYKQLLRDLQRMVASWQQDEWDFYPDGSSTYGPDPFKNVFMSENPQPWLEAGFERRVWDPVGRTEKVLSSLVEA